METNEGVEVRKVPGLSPLLWVGMCAATSISWPPTTLSFLWQAARLVTPSREPMVRKENGGWKNSTLIFLLLLRKLPQDKYRKKPNKSH